MKTLTYIAIFLFASIGFIACYDDEGNYTYLSDYEAGEIVIDTFGLSQAERTALSTLYPGDTVELELNVNYAYMENLRYRWFALPLTNYSYEPVQVGNSLEYPPADTISYEKKLHWVVDFDPGQYRFYFMAEDSVRGLKAYFQMSNYGIIYTEGTFDGLYLLTEYDGETDIDVYTSELMLIYTGDSVVHRYYSQTTGQTIPGKPRFIHGSHTGSTSRDGYLVATDQTNDRKFSTAISGDYDLAPFLAHETRSSYGAVEGTIDADQIVYDLESHSFRPYYSAGSSLSSFRSTSGDASIDANDMPTDPIAIFNGYNERTYCITEEEGVYYLYRFNFYNVVDDGDLSTDGARSKIDLSGCTGIAEATLFAANNYGHAFYYATPDAVHSFSPSSGATTSNTLYTCEPGEEVTALYTWNSGGWPTAGIILWIATWDENAQEGKLIEFEIDANYGTANWSFGPSMAPDHTNPYITPAMAKS